MILETLDLLVDHLMGPRGVNWQLAQLPLDPRDQPPAQVAAVLVRHRSAELAAGKSPNEYPFLLVELAAPFAGEPQNPADIRLGRLEVGVAYVTRGGEQDRAERDALYTVRAIVRSLQDFSYRADSVRLRHGIQVYGQTGISYGPVQEDLLGGSARAVALVTYQVRDTTPSPPS